MDKYDVKLMPKAERDIDGIYEYLAKNKEIPEIDLNLVNEIEKVLYYSIFYIQIDEY